MKIFFMSFGCDKNLVDSENMIGMLSADNYSFTQDESEADIIIVNTCCFINDAKEESINAILEMAEYKNSKSAKALIVTGCLAERYREEILKEIKKKNSITYSIVTNNYAEVYKKCGFKMNKNQEYKNFVTIYMEEEETTA